MNTARKNGGFTYVEMITTVSIISILMITSLYGINNLQRRAAYERAHKDINDIADAIYQARLNSGLRLNQITGENASERACRTTSGNMNTSDFTTGNGAGCFNAYSDAIDNINRTAGRAVIQGIPLDPWGSPYMINENEGQSGSGCTDTNSDGIACCTDNIGSAGPNRRLFTNSPSGYDTDDIVVNIPTLCKPVEGHHHPDQN